MGKSNVLERVRELLRKKGQIPSTELDEHLQRLRGEQTALEAAADGARASLVNLRAVGNPKDVERARLDLGEAEESLAVAQAQVPLLEERLATAKRREYVQGLDGLETEIEQLSELGVKVVKELDQDFAGIISKLHKLQGYMATIDSHNATLREAGAAGGAGRGALGGIDGRCRPGNRPLTDQVRLPAVFEGSDFWEGASGPFIRTAFSKPEPPQPPVERVPDRGPAVVVTVEHKDHAGRS